MDRTRFIEHKGRRILLFDYSGLKLAADALKEVEKTKEIVRRQPAKSLLVLTDVRDSHYDATVVQALKDLAAHNAPYVTASAVVGVVGLKRVVYSAVVMFSKRKLQLFDTREEALDWLAQQG
jgi:hypothetical protein